MKSLFYLPIFAVLIFALSAAAIPNALAGGPEINIIKQTTPNGSIQKFNFTSDLGNFTLSDNQNKAFFVFSHVQNHTITEIVPDGWKTNPVITCQPFLDTPQVVFGNASITIVNQTSDYGVGCIFNNVDERPGTIAIVKHTDPVNSTQKFNFTSNAGNFTLSDGQNKTFTLFSGNYNFTETVPPGWFNDKRTCTLNGSVQLPDIYDPSTGQYTTSINLVNGSHVVCNYYNRDDRSTITIIKQTDPNNSTQKFNFTSDAGNFTLSDGQHKTFTLAQGFYNFEETVPPGWKIPVGISCFGGIDSEDFPSSTGVSIDLAPREDVTCTFNNVDQHSTITIIKQTDPVNSTQKFNFTSFQLGNFTLSDGQNKTFTLVPGSYDFLEIVPPGWKTSGIISCPGGNVILSSPLVEINLAPRVHVTCTFNNFDQNGTITIIKHTNVNSTQKFNFTSNAGNFQLSDGQNKTFNLISGRSYSFTEQVPPGWKIPVPRSCSITTFGPSGPDRVSGVLGVRAHVTCNFNNEGTGAIIVEKKTIPALSLVKFNFTGYANFTLLDGQQKQISKLPPGNYSIIESSASGWGLTKITCNDTNSINDTTARKATFVLGPDEFVKCTFTNTKTIIVAIDIKPSDSKNTISINNDNSVRVAILGSTAVPVNLIDISPLSTDAPKFGGSTPQAPVGTTIQDVNGDGKPDLVLKYNQNPKNPLGFKNTDTQGCINGKLLDGTLIHGCDKVRIIK